MNTEQLKQAALNGDPDAASPEQILALLECVEALQSAVYHAGSPHEWKEQARAALQKLEAL